MEATDNESIDQTYSADTCSLIDGYADPTKRIILENLVRRGRLKAPPGVLGELEVGSDEVFHWAKVLEKSLIRELSPVSAGHLGDLVTKYGDPFPDPQCRGKIYRGLIKKGVANDADPEVIALALDYGWTVLTEERSGIRGASNLEEIPCVSLEELLRIEIPKQERQLRLV